ncbi:TonB-dependent receptor [Luteimonas suaedae]|uniref:TonB-dependent receptor n=1 Tax=Luteimonas suaedae TaxID=2605430 RepID=UPI0011EF219C|nr:TonB-dependent receptor [Luteimonas suaedae]
MIYAAVAAALASGTAQAQDVASAAQQATTLDRVVVTAEKQGRSQQDTATSTVVLDDRALQSRGLDDSRGVLANAANVTSVGTGNYAPAVRGVDGTGPAQGADAFFAGTRPRLNVSMDGRAVSYNELVFSGSSLWDVEQAELLRGPQSLLQGRNAIAGTLAIKTKDPAWAHEGGLRLLGGEHGRRQGAFYLSGPFAGDQVAFRLAGDVQRQDSYLDFTGFPGTRDPGKFENRTLRGKLLFKPDALPDFSALLTFQHAQSHAPQAEMVARPFEDERPATPEMPVFAPRTNAVIADTQWQIDDRLRWENLLTATDLHVDRFAPAGSGIARIDNREYVLEPRLVLERSAGSRIDGIAGIYLMRADQDEFIDFPVHERFEDHIRTEAVYGEGTIALREDLDLTLGARYERERHRRFGGEGVVVSIDIDKEYSAFMPKLGLAWRPSAAWTLGVLASRGYNAGGGGITFEVPITSYSFDPEYVVNYEAYFRGDLADGRLQLTGNLFHGSYRDMQLPFDLNPDPGVWSVVVRNADRARNMGAELGARWLARPGLELHADLGYLHTEVTAYPDSGIEGNEFAHAPSFTGNAGFTWRGAGGFELSANARYSDAYYSDILNRPLGRTEPYWLANAKGGYRFGRTYLFAGVDNLFDERTPLQIDTNALEPTPFDTAALPRPRSWYAGVQVDW